MDLSVETTGAKGKVAEDSNFPATAGSSKDPFTLHPQGDGAAMTMPKESVLTLASARDNTYEATGKAVQGPATGHHCWEYCSGEGRAVKIINTTLQPPMQYSTGYHTGTLSGTLSTPELSSCAMHSGSF